MNSKGSLVLGASGFLGSHLCEALSAAGQPVRAFGRSQVPLVLGSGKVEWAIGDFCDRAALEEAVTGCDTIYHLISTTVPESSNRDPIYDLRSNVEGTLQLLAIAQEAGVRKIVFVSSGGTVYGIPRSLPLHEDAPTQPICAYGISKLAIEKYLHMYAAVHHIDYCVLRVSNLFGERQPLEKRQGVVGIFLAKALRGETIEIWGDGEVVRDYVYVQDVAAALVKAGQYSGPETLFNIGSGQGYSLNQVLDSLEAVLKAPIARIYKPGRPIDVPINVLDISRARQVLGWQPETAWPEALKKTYAWMRQQI